MTDTTKMRAVVQDGNYKNVWLDGSTHYEGCEYSHYPCAVLKLCDEVDRLRAIIREVEWVTYHHYYPFEETFRACPVCDNDYLLGHTKACPFYKWEGGE
jgi:hypothetical protein